MWRVRVFGWAGATLKFVGRKPKRSGGLRCYEWQAELPWADCTPKAARGRAKLEKTFSIAQVFPQSISIIKRIHYIVSSQ